MSAMRSDDALDKDLWVWAKDDKIYLVAAAPGTDQVVLSHIDAERVARRLLELSSTS